MISRGKRDNIEVAGMAKKGDGKSSKKKLRRKGSSCQLEKMVRKESERCLRRVVSWKKSRANSEEKKEMLRAVMVPARTWGVHAVETAPTE